MCQKLVCLHVFQPLFLFIFFCYCGQGVPVLHKLALLKGITGPIFSCRRLKDVKN